RLRRRRTATSAIPAESRPPLTINRPPRPIPVTGRPDPVAPLSGALGSPLADAGGSSLAGGGGSSLAGGCPGQVWLRSNRGSVPSLPAGAVADPSTRVQPAGVTSHSRHCHVRSDSVTATRCAGKFPMVSGLISTWLPSVSANDSVN